MGLAIAAVGLTLPWTYNGSSALSFSAFDLAEWTTLVPEVRYGGNAMALPQNLRLLVVLLMFAMSLLPNRRFSMGWFACALIGLAGFVGLLPPFEYFIDPRTGFRGDSNYNQLMTLALIGLGAVILGLSGLLWRFKRIVIPLLVVGMVLLALSSATESLSYLNRYVPAQTGIGVGVFCSGLLLTGLTLFLRESKEGV